MTKAVACRVCRCTEERGCEEGCWWVQPGLCSSCVPAVRVTKCPDCGSGGKYCRRPSGHSGPMVAFHSERVGATVKAIAEMVER
jgi:hypothetical protein